jgi:hypothetical protein
VLVCRSFKVALKDGCKVTLGPGTLALLTVGGLVGH